MDLISPEVERRKTIYCIDCSLEWRIKLAGSFYTGRCSFVCSQRRRNGILIVITICVCLCVCMRVIELHTAVKLMGGGGGGGRNILLVMDGHPSMNLSHSTSQSYYELILFRTFGKG